MKIKHILRGGLLAGILTACNPVEEVGPLICPSDTFSLTADDLKIDVVSADTEVAIESSNNELDLSSGGAHFFSDFGEEVDWELTISNETQTKNYSGNGAQMDIYWYGQPNKYVDSKLQFDLGKVEVTLKVVCHDPVSKAFDLLGTQDFSSLNPKYGILIRDWDGHGLFPTLGDTFNVADGWQGAGGGITTWNVDYLNIFSSPSGGEYLQLHGAGSPSWYLGGHSFPTDGLSDNLGTQNVDSLYLNILVSAEEGAINTGSQIAVGVSGVNYLRVEDVNWEGWKLLSYKFSDFATNSGAPLPSTNIESFVLQLGAQPEQSSDLKVRYDFVLVTVGAPLFEE